MGWLKKIYSRICYKIYANGLAVQRKIVNEQFASSATSASGTIFHEGSGIINLSGIPEKIKLGANCHIYGQLIVYPHGGQIQFGDHCSLGENSRVTSGSVIKIGNRVMIAHNVNILDNNSHPKQADLRHEDFVSSYSSGMKAFDLDAKEIIIEDDVWIGFNSIILKGVRIGRGAIIGAGSMVTKDVEAWTVNVGNPLRCVEKLDSAVIK